MSQLGRLSCSIAGSCKHRPQAMHPRPAAELARHRLAAGQCAQRARRAAHRIVCHAHAHDGRKRAVVIGAGWAGLGAAHHLVSQGYQVDVLEASPNPGGLVAGWTTAQGRSAEIGIHGYWGSYLNIFGVCDDLRLTPFTDWTPSNQYSPAGLEVRAPIFRDMPRLPTPAGHFLFSDFKRIPLADRLTALPLLFPAADFDHSHAAWERYDSMSARELFRQVGISARLYKDAFNPMLLVGLFSPGEMCSAAACLGMLRFFLLSHQEDFDVKWCRGTTADMIFRPWIAQMEAKGARFHFGTAVRDFKLDAAGRVCAVTGASKDGHHRDFAADAAVLAVGINGMKKIVAGSRALQHPEFRRVGNLGSLDVLAARIWLDRKVTFPRPSNACSNFDQDTGWTFFALDALHDEFLDSPVTVLEANWYHSNSLMPLSDEQIVAKALQDIATCEPAVAAAKATDFVVSRCPAAVTHFSPGCFPSLLRRRTSIPNLFAAGDWIANTHGSYSQEKAFVTGLEAANEVVQVCGQGQPAHIQPLAADEAHVAAIAAAQRLGRQLQQSLNPLTALVPDALRSLAA